LEEGLLSQTKIDDSFITTNSRNNANDSMSMLSFRSDESNVSHMTVADSIQHKTFWHIFVMLTLSMSFCYFIKVVLKSFGSINFNDDKFITQVIGVSFLCGACARFVWGALLDIIGFKKVYAMILFMEVCLSFTIM
jgi:hypothetical protein